MKKKKIALISLICLFVSLLIVMVSFGILYLIVTDENVNISFDESVTYQTFNGFGASSAWNFRALGRDFPEEVQNEVISLLYGEEGLNLEIFRYNLGDGSAEVEDCYYDEYRKTETFFDASKFVDYSSFADESNYDFTRDSDYVSMMLKSFEIGNIRKLVIFSGSPHYLMTVNGKTHGTEVLQNNLKEEAYEAYADYYLICSNHIKKLVDEIGCTDVEIYLSPVNEPQWDWGGSGAIQQGCHFDYVELAKFYDVFYKKLKAFNQENNTNFIMDIYESGTFKINHIKAKNKKYLDEFAKYDYFDELEELSFHSYNADTSLLARKNFQKYLEGKGIDKNITISEYCVMKWGVDESVDMGIHCSKVVLRDLAYNNASEWSWWLGLAYGGYEDGLVYLDKETQEISLTYRYYMFKNIMDYIDVGDVRVKAELYDPLGWSGLDTVAFKKSDGRLIIIVLNDTNEDKNLTYLNLQGYSKIKTITTSDAGKLVEDEIEFTNTLKSSSKSITTYVFSN